VLLFLFIINILSVIQLHQLMIKG